MWLDLNFWITNPFVPWGRIWAGVILAIYLYHVFWVYRDAERRYYTGVWFALASAVLPLAGWMFYILYRASSLPEADVLELKERMFERYRSVDYDIYLARQRQDAFNRGVSRFLEFFAPPPVTEPSRADSQYPEEVMRSRARELEKSRSQSARESFENAGRVTKKGLSLIGGAIRQISSPRYSRAVKKLKFFQAIKDVPLEDEEVEKLLINGLYHMAREDCEVKLKLAIELGEERRVRAYEAYLERIDRLLDAPAKSESD